MLFIQLLIFIFLISISTTTAFLHVLPLHTSSTSSTIRRVGTEVDVLLRIQSYDKRWNVDQLLTYPDMTLPDQHSCMMNGLGQSQLEYLSLKTTLQEIFNFQTKNVIELHSSLVQDTNSHQPSQQSISFKKTATIFFGKGEEISSSLSDFGERKFDSPYFTFVTKSVFTNELQFLIQTTFLKGSTGSDVSFGTYIQYHVCCLLCSTSLISVT